MIKKLIFPLFLLTAVSAFADFNFFLSPNLQVTQPGGTFDDTHCITGSLMCVLFSGTVTNLDPVNEIDFTALSVTWDPSSPSTTLLTSNDDFFLNAWFNSGGAFGFPAFLAGGDSFTGILFEIDVPPLFNGDLNVAPFGQYIGTVRVDAVDVNSNPFVQSIPFEVDVVPEPAVWSLMLVGLSALVAVDRRRHSLFAWLRRNHL